MEKKEKITIIIATLILVFGIIMLIVKVDPIPSSQFNMTQTEIIQEKIDLSFLMQPDFIAINKTKQEYQNTLNKIIEIAQNVSNSHTYELHVFDCSNFSEELLKRLTDAGIKAKCVWGDNWAFTNYTNHTWISAWIGNERIEIESTGAYIIDSETFKTYQIDGEDLCW